MEGSIFERFCRELVSATLWGTVKEGTNRGAIEEARFLLARDLGAQDLDDLLEWAARHGGLAFEEATFKDLERLRGADELVWDDAKALVDDLEYEGFEKPKLTLLRLMRDIAPIGAALLHPVTVQDDYDDEAPQVGGAILDPNPIRLNPQIQESIPEYMWYWSRYITALVDLGRVDECASEVPDGMLVLLLGGQERASLAFSLGMLAGALTQRLQQGVTAQDFRSVVAAIQEASEQSRRRDIGGYELQLAIADKVSSVQTNLSVMNDVFLEALVKFEETAWFAESRSLADSRESLLYDWHASHTFALQTELNSRAEGSWVALRGSNYNPTPRPTCCCI